MFIVELLMSEEIFKEKPGCGSSNNVESVTTNLFHVGITTIATGVPLRNYICHARRNWNKNMQLYANKAELPLFKDRLDDLVEFTDCMD